PLDAARTSRKPPPPGLVRVCSVTQDMNAAAMHASTAFPPSRSTSAPASAVSLGPAATAPLIPGSVSPPRATSPGGGAAALAIVAPRDRPVALGRPRGRSLRGDCCRCGLPARLARAARSRLRRACVPAQRLPPARLRALEQLLVRRA